MDQNTRENIIIAKFYLKSKSSKMLSAKIATF